MGQKQVRVIAGPTGPTGTFRGVQIFANVTGPTGLYPVWDQINPQQMGTGMAGPTGGRYETVYPVEPVDVAATGTLTFVTNPSNGQTVTIGSRTYTFQDTLTNVDGNVKIAASAAFSLANLFGALNPPFNGGAPGIDYALATTGNTEVTGTGPLSLDPLDLTAVVAGVAGNSIATTTTVTDAEFTAATLTGGEDGSLPAGIIKTVIIPGYTGPA
jgi:hypothetical protein